MASYRPEALACISEKVLGFGRKLPEDSDRSGKSTPCSGESDLWSRTGSAVATIEQPCPEIEAGRLLYPTQYTMAESADVHPTAGRRRREKGPPSGLALPRLERVSDTEREHSDDSAGEKEAKRQRSEPSTPVSTPRRLPYEYDAIMGITKVGTKEAEGFDEDLDSTEYHDANDTTDDPTRKDETECITSQQRSMGFQGGYGSSSLTECIELLNAAVESAPAPLDSGVGHKPTDPPHKTLCFSFKTSSEAFANPSSSIGCLATAVWPSTSCKAGLVALRYVLISSISSAQA